MSNLLQKMMRAFTCERKTRNLLVLMAAVLLTIGGVNAQNVLFVKSGVTDGDVITVGSETGAAYTTLKEAVAHATTGDIVKLTEDVTEAGEVANGLGMNSVAILEGITIDGCGHSVTVTTFTNGENNKNSIIFLKRGTLKNLTLDGGVRGTSHIRTLSSNYITGDVTIDNCIINPTGDATYSLHILSDPAATNAQLTITNSILYGSFQPVDAFKTITVSNTTFGKGQTNPSPCRLRPWNYAAACIQHVFFNNVIFDIQVVGGESDFVVHPDLVEKGVFFNGCQIKEGSSTTALTMANWGTILTNANDPITDPTMKGVVTLSGYTTNSDGKITGGTYGGNPTSLNSMCANGYAAIPLGTSPETYQVAEAWTIHFNANGGTGSMADQYVLKSNPDFTVPAATGLSSTTSGLRGWNTKADGTGTSLAVNDHIILTSDTTLFAQWGNAARIGTTEYATLDAAIAAANENDVIEVIADACTISASAAIPAGVTITGQGKTNTIVTIASTSGSGLTLNNANVTLRDMTIDGSQITSGGYKTLVNVRADGCLITDVVMKKGGQSTWNSSILVETLNSSQTFTVRNSTISGSFRGVLRESCNANIVITNCDIDAVYPFNIDGGNGGTVTVTGGSLRGWTSYSGIDKVSFTDVEFGKGSAGYAFLQPYVNTEINGSSFSSDFGVNSTIAPTIFFNDCELAGVPLTSNNIDNLLDGATQDNPSSHAVVVNGGYSTNSDGEITGGVYGGNPDVLSSMLAHGYAAAPLGTDPETYQVTPVYYVHFNAGGGTGTHGDSIVPHSAPTFTVPANTQFTYDTYTFQNWNSKIYGAGTDIAVGSTMTLTSDTTLYAEWNLDFVAKIGNTTYNTLQAALDDAHDNLSGNQTIELVADITGYSIVHQKAGLNLTIEGNDHTAAGQIIVDGNGRASGTETLTIQNIAFQDDKSNFCTGTDAFILVPSTKTTGTPYYTGAYNYAHNITVDNCSFTSTSSSRDVVGIKATSSATCYNLVVNNTTGDNLHSLAQLTATEGALIDNCTAINTGSFVNISGGSAADTISNCTFTGVDPTDGYAVRENGGSSVEVTLINNTFEAKNVLQLGKNGGSNASGHINVESGTYKGILLNDQSAAGTATFVFTGGTYNQPVATVQGYCAPYYTAKDEDPEPGYCTVRKDTVAMIGTQDFPTLQMALDTAYTRTGDVTIDIVSDDINTYSVIREKNGLNLTIEGNNHTLDGQLIVNGMGHGLSGTGTVTIQNINFNGDRTNFYSGTDAFILLPKPANIPSPYNTNTYNYANHVTIDNCDFTSTSASLNVVGLKVTSAAGAYNVAFTNCTGTNLHSLAQLTGTTGSTFDHCVVTNSDSYINIDGGAGDHNISNCRFVSSVSDGYGVREKGSSGAVITLVNDTLTAASSLVLGKDDAPVGSINVESGVYNGHLVLNMNASGTATYSFTGGTFTNLGGADDVADSTNVKEKCATGYGCYKDVEGYPAGWTVLKMYEVTYNNNGGEGEMEPGYADLLTGEFTVPACTFTNGEWTFRKWNTKADGTGTDLSEGDVMTLTSDTILYAQWRGVAKIGDVHYTTLNAAVAAVPTGEPTTIEILQNLNFYDISSSNLTGKTITFTGTPTDTLSITPDNGDAEYLVTASGADLTFETITLWNPMEPDGKNRGIAHLNKMTINNCEVIGFMRGFAETFTCNNCTFTKTGKYHMWTYGSNITFNSCTFNSYGNSDCKAINVYKEGSLSQPYRVITFNDCEFNSTPAVTTLDNSAIQINSALCCFVVNINNCTVDGYINNSSSVTGYGNLVNNKSTSVATTLYIDGVQILKQGSCDPVAQIGDTYYQTLQAALDAAHEMTGDVTINILRNFEEDATILQKAGLNYIIEGNNDTLNGRIFVDGGRIFPNSVGEVTINNLNFTYNAGLTYTGDTKGFVCNSKNNLSYAAHVAVSNCTFDGGDPANGMCAYRDPSGAQSWDITLDRLVAKNCHSLVQATSVSGMVITNCKATDNVKNGINISGGGSDHIPGVTNIYTIANDTLTCNTDGEYSIRIQEHGRGTDTFNLADNMFTAPKAIVSKHNTAGVITSTSGLYDGKISLEDSDAATFSFTGGTFTNLGGADDVADSTNVKEKCAPGYGCYKDVDTYPAGWTVLKMNWLTFDANVANATGTMDTLFFAPLTPQTCNSIPACGYTNPDGVSFLNWNTKADGTGDTYAEGDAMSGITSDTVLYAQWSYTARNVNTNTYYTDLQAAIDAATAGDSIVLLKDIATDQIIEVTKNLAINGGNHTITTTATRGLWVDAPNVTLRLENFIMNGPNRDASGNSRGIQINESNVTLVMDNCRIYNVKHYAINIIGGLENINLNVTNSYVQGWAALNSYAANSTYTFVNDTLYGINPYDCSGGGSNNFGVIVLDGGSLAGVAGTETTTVSITSSVIIAEEGSSCIERWASIQYGSSVTNLIVDDDTRIIDGNGEDKTDEIFMEGVQNTITMPLDDEVVDSLIAAGFTVTDNENGTYTISHSVLYGRPAGSGYPADSVYIDFHVPFNAHYIANGEWIKLIENVTMTDTVTVGINGTMTLKFNGHTIDNADHYCIKLEEGDTVITDQQTTLFYSAVGNVAEIDNHNGTYTYTVAPYVAVNANTGVNYINLQVAVDAASSGDTIRLLRNLANGYITEWNPNGLLIDNYNSKDELTIDLNGDTLNLNNIYVATQITARIKDSQGNGAIIHTGNTSSMALFVAANSTLIMEGGKVSSNNLAAKVNGTLTMEDGTLTCSHQTTVQMGANNAVLNANGGQIINTYTGTDAGICVQVNNGFTAAINIDGADIIASDAAGKGILTAGNGNANITMTDGTIQTKSFAIVNSGSATSSTSKWVITGGTIESEGTAIFHAAPDSVVIGVDCTTGPTITGVNAAIEHRAGHLVIKGGELTATATSYSVTANGSGTTTVGAAVAVAQHTSELPTTVAISCGTFEGESSISIANPEDNTATNVEASITGGNFTGSVMETDDRIANFITGGTFSEDVDAHCAAGYTSDPNGTVPETWTVGMRVALNVNTDITYASLQTAVNEVTAGDTIRLLANINLTTTVNITNNLTLDLNGDTITGTAADVFVVDGGNLTIKDGGANGLMRNTGATNDDVIWLKNNGAVTLNSGKISSLTTGIYVGSSSSTATATINGGTVEGTEAALIVKSGDLTVNGGTIESAKRGIYLATATATATITDGTVVSDQYGVIVFGGTATIDGGAVSAPIYTVYMKDGSLEANGGTLTNTKNNPTEYAAVLYIDESSSVNILLAGTNMVATDTLTLGIWDMSAACNIRMTDGSINVTSFGIYNNGSHTASTSKWRIEGGTLVSTQAAGIYHAAPDSVIIGVDCENGPTITGLDAAIESRAGHLVIKGGTLTATATNYEVHANGNGTTTTGAAVAVAQHTTAVETNVNISCGTFVGEAAISITNPQGNTADNVTATITGGTFLGEVVSTDDRLDDYITGGIFIDETGNDELAPGYALFDTVIGGTDAYVVRPAYFFYYDKNHVSAIGTMDTIIKRRDAAEADRKIEVLNCAFTCLPDSLFVGWNTKADGTGDTIEVGDTILLVSDTTLYAQWKRFYTISYNNNGGAGHINDTVKYAGEDFVLSDGTAFSKGADSTLYRWNTAADESGANYPLGGIYDVDESATFYAVWRLNLNMTMSSTDVVCYGENNGTDTVKIIGGDPTYVIVLSSPVLDQNDTVRTTETQYVFTNLKPGVYNVELSDTLRKDFITGTFTIEEPDTLVASFVSVPVAPCPLMGTGNYEVAMTSTGGNGGNVYTWTGATDVNDTATVVVPGADDRDSTYSISVTVTDQKGCTAVIDTSFTVSPVIANDETVHSNTIMTLDTLNHAILYGCDTILRNFGTPHFTFTNAAITEGILDTIYNNVSTIAPDSVFIAGTTTVITWTAIDTCGHEVTAQQVINVTNQPCPSAFDYHGIEYPSVRIGCDCWTTKNLASTKYSDGRDIPDVRTYPINTRASVYGNLYTYKAAMDGANVEDSIAHNIPIQGACPEGWHVPSQAEAQALMSSAEVEALMSQGTWLPDNGTNATGFTMLPGGFYNSELDRYERMYVSAYIWVATPESAIYHACEFGSACSSLEFIPGSLTDGLSIRCVITKPTE